MRVLSSTLVPLAALALLSSCAPSSPPATRFNALGDLETIAIDDWDGSARVEHRVRLGDETLRAVVKTPQAVTRHGVRLRGVRRGDEVTLDDEGSDAVSDSPPITPGAKTLLMMRVDFSDIPGDPRATVGLGPPLTSGDALALANSVSSFYSRITHGRNSISGTATTLLRMPRSAADYVAMGSGGGTGQLLTDARAAALAAGFDPAAYDYDFVYFTRLAWGFQGLALVGSKGGWINGGFSPLITAHELGHNFGLQHSGDWVTTDESVFGPGSKHEYGDVYEVMGDGTADPTPGQLGAVDMHVWYKRHLGFLSAADVTPITVSGRYTVRAQDVAPMAGAVVGLQIARDATTDFFVEYRTQSNALLRRGALIHVGNGVTGGPSRVLDFTPASPAGRLDAPLPFGQTYSDPAGVHLTPLGPLPGQPDVMEVVVNLGTFPGNRAPSLMLSASTLTPAVGASVTLSATASDLDGDPLAMAWTFDDDGAGASGAMVSRAFTSPGKTFVRCTVSDMKGGTRTASLLLTVGGGAGFSISGQVLDGTDAGIAGTRVSTAGRTVFTDSNGAYTVGRLDAGTYSVSATRSGYSFSPLFSGSVSLGPDADSRDFRGLQGSYSISGVVQDRGTSLFPVSDVVVSDGTHTSITDATGTYVLAGLIPGGYTLTATKPGAFFQPNAIFFSNPVIITNGNRTDISFERVSYGVTGSTFGLMEEARVTIGDGVHEGGSFETAPPTWGYFVSVPQGRWNLVAQRSGFTLVPRFTNPVTISAPTAGLDFDAVVGPSTLIWSTVTLDDAPLTDVRVSDGTRTSTTDDLGRAVLVGVPPGVQTVTPSAPGYSFTPPSQRVTVGSSDIALQFIANRVTDAGITDAGPPPDAGIADAGPPTDAGIADAGPPNDAGPADAGPATDAGPPTDAGVADAGTIDAGPPTDAGVTDAGVTVEPVLPDEPAQGGCGCSTADATWLMGLALLAIRRRR